MDLINWLVSVLFFGLFTLTSTAQCNTLQLPNIKSSELDIYGGVQFETSSRLLVFGEKGVHLSDDYGKNWEKLNFQYNGVDLEIIDIVGFDYYPNIAMVFTNSRRHFYTFDQGNTWKQFDIATHSEIGKVSVQINYFKKDYMLFIFYCNGSDSDGQLTYYSNNGLKTPPKATNMGNLKDCTFTKINPYFTEGGDSMIVCVRKEVNSYSRIVSTTDFFKTFIESDRPEFTYTLASKFYVSGSFVILELKRPREVVMIYTSKDGKDFSRQYLDKENIGSKIISTSSTKDAMFIFVKDLHPPLTTVYKSDADGKNFEKIFGNASAIHYHNEQVTGNVWIASFIDKIFTPKLGGVRQSLIHSTKISFDDGENWGYLNVIDFADCNNDVECSLHLSAKINIENKGGKPAVLIGLGNLGKNQENSLEEWKTFISIDGGLSWKKLYDKPCHFALGDSGNIFVAVPYPYSLSGRKDEFIQEYILYSFDQGKTWNNVSLGMEIEPSNFFEKKKKVDNEFILYGSPVSGNNDLIINIDFSGMDYKLDIKQSLEWDFLNFLEKDHPL